MSLFCNTNRRCGQQSNCCSTPQTCAVQTCTCTCQKEPVVSPATQDNCTCTCSCECECTVTPTTVVQAAVNPEPVLVRAIINQVLDSCCDTDDVCREICVHSPDIFDPDELECGSPLKVALDGDITFREVNRDKDDCVCLSTVRFNIPIRIYGADECCCRRYITRNITVIRSVRLCCTRDSVLTTNNTRLLAGSAVVTEICGCDIRIMLSLLFRSCIQQTLPREYEWEATPVCVTANCADSRASFTDPCDVICGCVAGKTCPSC